MVINLSVLKSWNYEIMRKDVEMIVDEVAAEDEVTFF